MKYIIRATVELTVLDASSTEEARNTIGEWFCAAGHASVDERKLKIESCDEEEFRCPQCGKKLADATRLRQHKKNAGHTRTESRP